MLIYNFHHRYVNEVNEVLVSFSSSESDECFTPSLCSIPFFLYHLEFSRLSNRREKKEAFEKPSFYLTPYFFTYLTLRAIA